MERITKKDAAYIAGLARLALTEKEIEVFTDQLGKILEYMDKLNEVDTSAVKLLSEEPRADWRKDAVRPSEFAGDIVSNAPQSEAGYFKVKKIIE